MKSLLNGINNKSIEVIFVDDCCPENSINVCKQFILDHEEDIIFKHKIINLTENQGQATARNVALDEAKGRYIGFIDSDDAISSSYWKVLQPYIEKNDYDIIEFGFEEFSSVLPASNDIVTVNELPSSNLNPFYTGFFVWTRLYRKEFIKDIVFPTGKLYEDIYYNIYAFSKVTRSIRIDCSLIFYRKRFGSTTSFRTSSYSDLLINLINAIQQTIEYTPQKKMLISLLQRKLFILMLKGLNINESKERRRYYRLCTNKLMEVSDIEKKYGSNFVGRISYLFSKFICIILN
jgi:glycosyltransferase involved in cell wall biosynthesis